MPSKFIELMPIREDTSDYDIIEKKIKELFKKELYYPIFSILKQTKKSLTNSNYSALEQAIRFDKIIFSHGTFTGVFTSSISKDLKAIGATWDSKTHTYKLNYSKIPPEIKSIISTSKARFDEKIGTIDKMLSTLVPEQIASKLYVAPQFDSALWKVEKDFKKSVEKITVEPQLSRDQTKKVADEWQTNMDLWIKGFTEERIIELRKIVKENVYAGYRRENLQGDIVSLLKSIKADWPHVEKKAKFLARQETNLLMAKYKETKYVQAGVPDYRWACVKMPHQPSPTADYKKGEVRYSHGILEGKIFSWLDPPITTAPGQPERRNNPGCDYNCRCFAIPLLRLP